MTTNNFTREITAAGTVATSGRTGRRSVPTTVRCIQCNKFLTQRTRARSFDLGERVSLPEFAIETGRSTFRGSVTVYYLLPTDRPGPYGDGFFCTLRCGHKFAVAAARHGYRG